jgi:hypothetical protein
LGPPPVSAYCPVLLLFAPPAADFATSNVVGSPAALIAAVWNHSRSMEDQAAKQGLKLPTLKGQELADMSAYLRSLTKASATRQTQ